jgi:hypothetical protein
MDNPSNYAVAEATKPDEPGKEIVVNGAAHEASWFRTRRPARAGSPTSTPSSRGYGLLSAFRFASGSIESHRTSGSSSG